MSSPPPPRANGVVTVTVNGCGIGVQQPVDTPGGPVHSKGGPLSPAAVSNTELRRRLDLLRRWFADFDDAQRTMAVQAIQVGDVIISCLMLPMVFSPLPPPPAASWPVPAPRPVPGPALPGPARPVPARVLRRLPRGPPGRGTQHRLLPGPCLAVPRLPGQPPLAEPAQHGLHLEEALLSASLATLSGGVLRAD